MKYKVLIPLMIIALMFIPACQQEEALTLPQLERLVLNWTVSNETEFLNLCEEYNISPDSNITPNFWLSYQDPEISVYIHHRKIDGIPVTGNRIWYEFDHRTGELTKKEVIWRDDLPDEAPEIMISKEEILERFEGAYAHLTYIEPSEQCPIEPTTNPCWYVSHWVDLYDPVTNTTLPFNDYTKVVDAVTGQVLGDCKPAM